MLSVWFNPEHEGVSAETGTSGCGLKRSDVWFDETLGCGLSLGGAQADKDDVDEDKEDVRFEPTRSL